MTHGDEVAYLTLGLVCGLPELAVRESGTPGKCGGVANMIIIIFDPSRLVLGPVADKGFLIGGGPR